MASTKTSANGSATLDASMTPPPGFEVFDKHNAIGQRGQAQKCSLTFNVGGNFRLSKKLVELLKLKPGAGVAFTYQKEEENWYVYRDDKNGFELRDKDAGVLQFNSSVIAKKIAEAFTSDFKSGCVLVSEEVTRAGGLMLHGILTNTLKSRQVKD